MLKILLATIRRQWHVNFAYLCDMTFSQAKLHHTAGGKGQQLKNVFTRNKNDYNSETLESLFYFKISEFSFAVNVLSAKT